MSKPKTPCSFYFGMGPIQEYLGQALDDGWDQPVLDAANTSDYYRQVLRGIDHGPRLPRPALQPCRAYTWFDATLWVRDAFGVWKPITPTLQEDMLRYDRWDPEKSGWDDKSPMNAPFVSTMED